MSKDADVMQVCRGPGATIRVTADRSCPLFLLAKFIPYMNEVIVYRFYLVHKNVDCDLKLHKTLEIMEN